MHENFANMHVAKIEKNHIWVFLSFKIYLKGCFPPISQLDARCLSYYIYQLIPEETTW